MGNKSQGAYSRQCLQPQAKVTVVEFASTEQNGITHAMPGNFAETQCGGKVRIISENL